MQRSPTCPLCHHVFGTKDPSKQPGPNTPLLLLCGHTFCERCMAKAAKNQVSQIECPHCKKSTQLKDDIGTAKSLWPDIYKLGVLAFNRRQGVDIDYLKLSGGVQFKQREKLQHSASQEPCNECSERIATCMCIKCDAKMCSLCFEKIHQGKTLRKHVAVPLVEGLSDLSTPETCETHQQPIEYFCELDSNQICSKCIIFGDHKGHPVTTLDEKNKQAMAEIEPLMTEAEKVLRVMKKSNKVISGTLADIQLGIAQLIEDVRSHFSSLHSALQAREIMLLQEVVKLKEVKLAQPEELRCKLLEESKKIEYALAGAEKLKLGLEQMNAQSILSKLSSASMLPCCALRADTQQPDAQFHTNDEFFESIRNYGELVSSQHQRLEMRTLADMPEDFVDEDLPPRAGTPESASTHSTATEAPDNVSELSGGTSEASSAIVRGRKSLKRTRTQVVKSRKQCKKEDSIDHSYTENQSPPHQRKNPPRALKGLKYHQFKEDMKPKSTSTFSKSDADNDSSTLEESTLGVVVKLEVPDDPSDSSFVSTNEPTCSEYDFANMLLSTEKHISTRKLARTDSVAVEAPPVTSDGSAPSAEPYLLRNSHTQEAIVLPPDYSITDLRDLLAASGLDVNYVVIPEEDMELAASPQSMLVSNTRTHEVLVLTPFLMFHTLTQMLHEKGVDAQYLQNGEQAVTRQDSQEDSAHVSIKDARLVDVSEIQSGKGGRYLSYNGRQMKQAITAVLEQQMTLRAACNKFGVPRTTLYRKLNDYTLLADGRLSGDPNERRKLMSTAEEARLAQYCREMMRTEAGLHRADIGRFMIKIMEEKQATNHKFNYETGPTPRTIRNFLNRHPELKVKRQVPTVDHATISGTTGASTQDLPSKSITGVSKRGRRRKVTKKNSSKSGFCEFSASLYPYKCAVCHKRFKNDLTCKMHMKTHNSAPVQRFHCLQCDKSFSRPVRLQQHILTHSGVKAFRCEHCMKAFTTSIALRMHAKRHTEEPKFCCKLCDKSYYTLSNLTSHYLKHTGERPYKCNFCEKTFRIKYERDNHELRHSSEAVQCKICRKYVKNQELLSEHEKSHKL